MKLKKSAAIAFLFSICVAFTSAATKLGVPALTSPVMDTAKIMSDSARAELEEYLLTLDKNSSAQVAVLTIPSLQNESLEEYAIKVCREWGLGNKEDSKGVLLLVAFEEKKIRIETGYGAEGDLTDAKCGLIIRNIIAPSFQKNDYSAGITNGAKAIATVLVPNLEDGIRLADDGKEDFTPTTVLIFFFIIYFIIFTGALSTKFKALKWLPWAQFFVNSSNHSHSSHYTTFSNFGSSGGGFSGGGFRGGGGGFGGGGASGGW